jgi:class 3 adenylate cyclase
MLKPLFGRNIQQLLNKKEIQNLLRTKKITELEEVFNIFSNALSQKQLTLSYLFAYAPNEKSESYLADIRNHNQASILEDFYSIAVYETHKDIDPFGKIPLPVLSKTQKQWLKPLQNFGNRDFVKNLFIDALEQEVFFNLGGENKNYFYSTIVLDHGKINKYLVFGSINEITFRNFLRNEIDSINTEDSTIFLAAEKRDNSDFTIFPFKKMNVLNSSMGKAAFNFIKLCRDSIFTRHMIGKDHIFVYYPLKDMNKYACGCIIDLTEPNLELQQKKLFLYSFGAVLILMLYFITAFAVNYIFQPIDQVSAALKHIAGGSFDIKLASKRKDEIGDLIRTLEIMVKGFKKRLKLGKYVSGTLDKTIHQLADKNKAKPTKKIQGTILFSDIRSFTTLSENNSPEKVSEMLNNHLQAMSQIIQKFSGDIEQFIGDAVIALFTGPDSKELALNAAIQMRKVHNSIIESRKTQNQFIYEIGIGIETGQLITTSVTTPSRAEFIVIGSARTSAEKYESESRHGSHSRIIVSKNFLETRIDFANLVKLPGTELYEVNF